MASYSPVDGRVSYLAGVLGITNFQETFFNNNDTHSVLGRSQSFALLLQALGDLTPKSSLMAEVTLGNHKFSKETGTFLDDYKIEAISFDLGYRRLIGGNFWISGQLGSMYAWRVTQKVHSKPSRNPESDFASIYSIILGLQYESELFGRDISYGLRIQKYMTTHIDDQMGLGLSAGYRFGM